MIFIEGNVFMIRYVRRAMFLGYVSREDDDEDDSRGDGNGLLVMLMILMMIIKLTTVVMMIGTRTLIVWLLNQSHCRRQVQFPLRFSMKYILQTGLQRSSDALTSLLCPCLQQYR